MRLHKLDLQWIDEWPRRPELKGSCVALPGALSAVPELAALPDDLAPCLPAVILCAACDAYLERLLNERGVAVTAPLDPVEAVPDGAHVTVDLAGGVLTEVGSGRRFALRALAAEHLAEIASHG